MKIELNYTTEITVQYDDVFEQYLGHVDLDHAKDTNLFMFSEYNFTKGVATDTETGEVLLTIDADDDDGGEDDDDEYTDDDDSPGSPGSLYWAW